MLKVSSVMYPAVNIRKAIENGHLEWIYPLRMVIFHSYVSLPEGIQIRCLMALCLKSLVCLKAASNIFAATPCLPVTDPAYPLTCSSPYVGLVFFEEQIQKPWNSKTLNPKSLNPESLKSKLQCTAVFSFILWWQVDNVVWVCYLGMGDRGVWGEHLSSQTRIWARLSCTDTHIKMESHDFLKLNLGPDFSLHQPRLLSLGSLAFGWRAMAFHFRQNQGLNLKRFPILGGFKAGWPMPSMPFASSSPPLGRLATPMRFMRLEVDEVDTNQSSVSTNSV